MVYYQTKKNTFTQNDRQILDIQAKTLLAASKFFIYILFFEGKVSDHPINESYQSLSMGFSTSKKTKLAH